MPSAAIVFDTLFAYQQSAALKSAIDLEVFTVIDDGAQTTAAIATRCGASERELGIWNGAQIPNSEFTIKF